MSSLSVLKLCPLVDRSYQLGVLCPCDRMYLLRALQSQDGAYSFTERLSCFYSGSFLHRIGKSNCFMHTKRKAATILSSQATASAGSRVIGRQMASYLGAASPTLPPLV